MSVVRAAVTDVRPTTHDHSVIVEKGQNPTGKNLKTGNHGPHLDLIGGLERVKTRLAQACLWPVAYPEAMARMGLRSHQGVLLYGPPGCAKTLLVRALARQYNISLVCLSGAQIFSPHVGDSEKTLVEAFRKAAVLSPSILFLDEIDTLIGERSSVGSGGTGVRQKLLGTLLDLMDGVGQRLDHRSTKTPSLLVVAATNRPQSVDAALLRPGRFDRLIYVPPPTMEERVSILRLACTGVPLDEEVDLESLATLTNRFTGAELMNLVREAALAALTENLQCLDSGEAVEKCKVKKAHFAGVLARLRPTLSENDIGWFEKFDSGVSVDTE